MTLLLVLATALPATTMGQTEPPDYQRDGEIYFEEVRRETSEVDESAAAACHQLNNKVVYLGWNKRTVGNGLAGQLLDSEGAPLLGPDGESIAVKNGLLAPTAKLRIVTQATAGRVSGSWGSYVSVNGCRATGTDGKDKKLYFYYGPGNYGRDVAQELTVNAKCLRFGVRADESADEPVAKANEIEIQTPGGLPYWFTHECGDHAGSSVRTSLRGDATWWDSQLPEFRNRRLEPLVTGGGEANARLWAHPHEILVEFEALAPIALVHGYTSSVQFWTNHDETGPSPETAADRFTAPLDERGVGYGLVSTKNASGEPSTNHWNKEPNIAPGPTDTVAKDLKPELRALAKRFGANYVNIVSHSMGAIWSRAVIEQLKGADPSEDLPGVLTFVSTAPMHHGSVLADLREVYAWRNIPKFFVFGDVGPGGFPLWKRMMTRIFGRADASLPFATTWESAKFNSRQELPEGFRVKGVRTQLSKWTLANSFNGNENCNDDNLDRVECGENPGDPDECRRQRSRFLWFDLSRGVNQERSNTLQRLQRVEISSTPSGELSAEFILQPFPAAAPTPGCPYGRYPLNDFTLRTEHMFFRHFNVLPGTPGYPYRFANHAMVGHRSVAEELLGFPLCAAQQKTLRDDR